MIEEKLLSEFEIARELHTGIAVTRFLLNRFETFLPTETSSGRKQYPITSIELLVRIKQALEKGQSPGQIEKTIAAIIEKEQNSTPANNTELSSNENDEDANSQKESVGLAQADWLKDLLADLGEQQKRLAIAQEKRVQAEERKAAAIEKRAIAEEQKAIAMGNIASALQELTALGAAAADPQISQIACQTAQIFPMEEDLDMDITIPQPTATNPSQEDSQDLSLLLDDAFPKSVSNEMPPMAILDDPNASLESNEGDLNYLSDLDDLNDLIDTVAEELPELETPSDMDDLASLLAPAEPTDPEGSDADSTKTDAADLDNLSALIDEDPAEKNQAPVSQTQALDNLSLLLEEDERSQSEEPTPVPESQSHEQLDDLSLLLESENLAAEAPADAVAMNKNIDDLSLLVDPEPSLKPAITPQEDLEAYKAAIIDIIIKQKTDGQTPEETAERMNKDEVQTLSGKPKWSVKAVEQIYKFIDAAKQ